MNSTRKILKLASSGNYELTVDQIQMVFLFHRQKHCCYTTFDGHISTTVGKMSKWLFGPQVSVTRQAANKKVHPNVIRYHAMKALANKYNFETANIVINKKFGSKSILYRIPESFNDQYVKWYQLLSDPTCSIFMTPSDWQDVLAVTPYEFTDIEDYRYRTIVNHGAELRVDVDKLFSTYENSEGFSKCLERNVNFKMNLERSNTVIISDDIVKSGYTIDHFGGRYYNGILGLLKKEMRGALYFEGDIKKRAPFEADVKCSQFFFGLIGLMKVCEYWKCREERVRYSGKIMGKETRGQEILRDFFTKHDPDTVINHITEILSKYWSNDPTQDDFYKSLTSRHIGRNRVKKVAFWYLFKKAENEKKQKMQYEREIVREQIIKKIGEDLHELIQILKDGAIVTNDIIQIVNEDIIMNDSRGANRYIDTDITEVFDNGLYSVYKDGFGITRDMNVKFNQLCNVIETQFMHFVLHRIPSKAQWCQLHDCVFFCDWDTWDFVRAAECEWMEMMGVDELRIFKCLDDRLKCKKLSVGNEVVNETAVNLLTSESACWEKIWKIRKTNDDTYITSERAVETKPRKARAVETKPRKARAVETKPRKRETKPRKRRSDAGKKWC